MTTRKDTGKKYVVPAILCLFLTILCSAIIDHGIADILYIIAMGVCAVRYIIICIKE